MSRLEHDRGEFVVAVPRIFGIFRIVNNGVWIEAVFQRGQADDGFENRAGRVIFLRRAVDFRAQFRVVQIFLDSLDKIIRVERRRRNHRQHVAAAHVHDDNRAARIRALMRRERFLRRALDVEVNRQHDIVARLRLAPDVFRLAIAELLTSTDSPPARPRNNESKPHSIPVTPR